jgi:nitrate/TMAO reductase-like tetraheme cytochrome c subunit
MRKIKTWRFLILALGLGLVAVAAALSIAIKPVEASQVAAPVAEADNSTCLYCHGREGMTMTMPSGEVLSLTIDPSHFSDSVHNGLTCTTCHKEITGYPHPEFNQQTSRDVSMKWYTSCQECHKEQYDKTLDSVHQRALATGNTNAAICTDCHNPHSQTQMTDPATGALLPEARLKIPQTCARCHSTIYNTYKESVHGAALTEEGNTDVPTCINCHGVHNIQDPTTVSFKLDSPEMCGKCHTNNELMGKYGISTNVLNTYVADFHGTTVTLFEKTSPNQPTNKPVCFDCHGVHNIKRVDDPVYGLQMKENMLTACQRCHPDATINFPDAWMSHYIPSPTKYPIVYYVNLFYKFFIPTVIGGMGIFVVSDMVRRLIERIKGAKHA